MHNGEKDDPLISSDLEGSGASATLAFGHIMISGLLVFGCYFLLGKGHEAHLASPHLAWQFMLPAAIGILTHLPTDPLTKAISGVSVLLGWTAIVCTMVTIVITQLAPARQSSGISLSQILFVQTAGWLCAFLTAWAIRQLLKRLILSV